MAEPSNKKKPNLRDLLEEIADDEEFTDEARNRAKEDLLEMEYKQWSSRVTKSKA